MSSTDRLPPNWTRADETTPNQHTNIPISGFRFDDATIQRLKLQAGQYHNTDDGYDAAVYALVDWAARIDPTTFTTAPNNKLLIHDYQNDANSTAWLTIPHEEVINLEDMR